jgi:hypothetical protein
MTRHRKTPQYSKVNTLLSLLDKPKQTGPGRWLARCPSHDDKSPSLRVSELDNGLVLVKCFAGCELTNILAAIGLDFDALFPDRPEQQPGRKREISPWYGIDILKALEFETLIVLSACETAGRGGPITTEDIERLRLSYARISEAARINQKTGSYKNVTV